MDTLFTMELKRLKMSENKVEFSDINNKYQTGTGRL